MRVQDASPPPTSLPTPTLEETRKLNKTVVQQATGALPGASIADAVRDSQRIGMQIMPALRAGDYKGAASAFIGSTAAALGAIPEVHNLAGFAGVIAAYHGSPHIFDEFKSSAIGTGEGAQAYGHGLYFAEDPKVAKSYRDSLAEKGSTVGGKPLDTGDPEHIAASYLHMHGGDRQAALDLLKADAAEAALVPHLYKPGEIEAYKTAPGILESGRPLPEVKEGGALYSVKLDVNHDDLLDWDKPLSEQSPGVREKLHGHAETGRLLGMYSAAEESSLPTGWKLDKSWEAPNGVSVYNVYDDSGRQMFQGSVLSGKSPEEAGRKAGAVFRDYMLKSGPATGGDLYKKLMANKPGDSYPAASEALRQAGIPGIRYLDAGSRGAGDGTRNVVMFDPSLIKIESVNGQPVPTAAEKASAGLQILAHPEAWGGGRP